MTLEPLDRAVNYTGKIGAELLANRIRAVWRGRGHAVNVYVMPRSTNQVDKAVFYDVRSDLMRGLP